LRAGDSTVAFSPDDKLFVLTDKNHIIQLWDIDWLAQLCRLANRNLSYSEWQQFMGQVVPYHRTCPNLPDGEGFPQGHDKRISR